MTRRDAQGQESAPPLHSAAFTFLVKANAAPPLAEIRSMISAFMASPSRSEHEQACVLLIIEEWATNLSKHGCISGTRQVATVTLKNFGYSVGIRLEDDCLPFDPTQFGQPELEADLEGRQIGGLGVHLIRSLVEELRYRRENGKNIWEMVRRIDAP